MSALCSLSINRYLIIIGHFSFLVLLFLSIYYYKERVVFIDTVFQFFKIVNFEKINIEADRYSALLTQIPLLLGVKAHLSLRSLMLVYSMSFIVVYYIVFILCVHTFKNIPAGLTIVFVFLLCIKQSFYHSSTETHQGLVYTALLSSILFYPFKENYRLLRYSLICIAVVLCFFSHPVTLFTVLFVAGYYLIDKSKWRDTGAYLSIGIVTLLSVLKLFLVKNGSYEGNIFADAFNIIHSYTNLPNFYSTLFFRHRLWGLYFWLWFFFVLTIGILILQKEYFKSGFVITSTMLFLIITLVTYNKGDSGVMMERAFMPLTIFVIIPFIQGVALKARNLFAPIIFCLIIVSLFTGLRRLNREGQRLKANFKYVERIIEKTNDFTERKFLLKKSEEINSHCFLWTFPFTSIVVSSMDGKSHTMTIFLYDDLNKWDKYLHEKPDIFLGADFWLEWKSNELNHHYFNLADEPYQILEQ